MQSDLCPGAVRESYGIKQHWNWKMWTCLCIRQTIEQTNSINRQVEWIKIIDSKSESLCFINLARCSVAVSCVSHASWQHTDTEILWQNTGTAQHTGKKIQAHHTGTAYRHTTEYRHRHTAYRDSIQAQHPGTAYCTGAAYRHKVLLELYQIFLGSTSSNLGETWNVE